MKKTLLWQTANMAINDQFCASTLCLLPWAGRSVLAKEYGHSDGLAGSALESKLAHVSPFPQRLVIKSLFKALGYLSCKGN